MSDRDPYRTPPRWQRLLMWVVRAKPYAVVGREFTLRWAWTGRIEDAPLLVDP